MHNLGMEFKTPTINLQILPEEYPKFCANLKDYMSAELKRCSGVDEKHFNMIIKMFGGFPDMPMGIIDDVLVMFQHYKNFDEAQNMWSIRKKRIDYDNIGFIFHARGEEYKQEAQEFMSLDLPNKLCLTEGFSIPGSISFEGEAFSSINNKLLITQVYDFKKWMMKQ